MKQFLVLVVIGVIYCGELEEETAIDSIAASYERYGNGVEAPEKLEIIKEKCNELGSTSSTGSKFFWHVVTGMKWAGYLKPKVRDMILERPSIAFYEKVISFCALPDDKQVKYGPVINAKLTETKKLRDRIDRDYWTKVVAMHDDLDGFREFSRKRIEVYPDMFYRVENYTGVKAAEKCEMKESYPEAKYKSHTVLVSKIMTKYYDSAL